MSAAYVCIICGESESNTIDLYVRKSKKLGRDDHRREQSTDAQTEQGHRWSHRKGYAVRKVWKDIASAFRAVKRSDFDRALAALARIRALVGARGGARCARCGSLVLAGGVDVDHVQPLALGGENTDGNVQPLCHGCHLAKTGEDFPGAGSSEPSSPRTSAS